MKLQNLFDNYDVNVNITGNNKGLCMYTTDQIMTLITAFLISSLFYFCIGILILSDNKFANILLSQITIKIYESIVPKEKRIEGQHRKFMKSVGFFVSELGN